MMKNSKTCSNIYSALVLCFSSSLMAMDIRTESDNLSPLSFSIDGAAPVDEGAGAAPGRKKREAHRDGGSVSGSSDKKDSDIYIKSARTGVRVNLSKMKNGYSMMTPEKIQVSVNPVGKSFRGSQPISKIDSKVRFHGAESDFLYFTLRAEVTDPQFRLVFMKNEADSSKLYLGYYEEDENRLIDPVSAAPLLLKDVIVRLNGTDSAVNSTAVPAYAAQPSGLSLTNDTFVNTTGLPMLSSKRSEFKPFRPVLMLNREQEYSIEVAWKSTETLSSVSMPDPGSMTYTTVAPSSTFPTLPTSSTPAVDMAQTTPEAAAAIPEDVDTQIILRNKDGEILTTLNLDLTLRHYSFSDANGQLLGYGVDGPKVNLTTKINTQDDDVDVEYDDSESDKSDSLTIGLAVGGSILGWIAMLYCFRGLDYLCKKCHRTKRSDYLNMDYL